MQVICEQMGSATRNESKRAMDVRRRTHQSVVTKKNQQAACSKDKGIAFPINIFKNGYIHILIIPSTLLVSHPPLHYTPAHSATLQEQSNNGTSSHDTANLEAGSSASELARRRRVRAGTRRGSSARWVGSAHDGGRWVAGASRRRGSWDHDGGRVWCWAGGGVGGGCRGSVGHDPVMC
jgi:hypothetical protein